jgi:hypothetical protein
VHSGADYLQLTKKAWLTMIILTPDTLQWLGCATGASGALLVASKVKYSGYGFILFLTSNMFWTAYGLAINAPGLIVMQGIFTITSLIGIYRWLIKPEAGRVVEVAPSNQSGA